VTGPKRPATLIAEAGRKRAWTHGPDQRRGIVNPPVWHASTILFDSLADLDAGIADADDGLYYGRRGTPTSWALESALTDLEPGAAGTKLYPSGVAGIAAALLTVLKAGDHLLVVDTAYEPTRTFATRLLRDFGITTTYYDPLIGADIAALIQPNTRAILLESPGSLSFEVQDIPAIVAVARAHSVATILDNTWATPLLFAAIGHGVDFSVQALTKYVAGHSDVMMGAVTTTEKWLPRLKATSYRLGYCVAPDDAYLTLRGLRTLGLRLRQQGDSALAIAQWLAGHPAVDQVLHPALPSCPGHDAFVRDFAGASGLFGVRLKQGSRADTGAMIDHLDHFGIGFSWGGFESLILPATLAPLRTATRPPTTGALLRLSIGLEDPADLIADLEAGLARFESQF
jgi:cysteine-S-conjugate beta-lyase